MPEPLFPIKPFELPLSREALCAALRDGRGRAWMHVRECVVRNGCEAAGAAEALEFLLLHGHRYDHQIEAERSAWLVDLTAQLASGEELLRRVVERLTEPTDPSREEWRQGEDLEHRIDTALTLAKRGVDGAREALYGLLHRREGWGWTGWEQIVELDSAAGVVQIARVMTGSARTAWFESDAHDVVTYFERLVGKDAARAALAGPMADEPGVAAFVAAADAHKRGLESERERHHESERYRSLAGSIIARIWLGQTKAEVGLRHWGKTTAETELGQVYAAWRADRDPPVERLLGYAAVFMDRYYAEAGPMLYRLSVQEDQELRVRVHHRLSHHRHEAVRTLALQKLDGGAVASIGERALRLFVSNYMEGDAARIERALWLPQDRDDLHVLCRDLLDVLKANRPSDAGGLLAFVYEHTPCAECRGRTVELARDMRTGPEWTGPEWLLEEARFDGSAETRRAAGGEEGQD